MIIGIDASNIRRGGGVTHLIELLQFANPSTHGFSKIVLWSGQSTLACVPNLPWLIKEDLSVSGSSFFRRSFWQKYQLPIRARFYHCDVLFVPGGTYTCDFHPTVAMSQNLLPFEWKELARYGWSLVGLRFLLLRFIQVHTFRSVDGVIFLTRYAKATVERVTGDLPHTKVIPHGLNSRFRTDPKPQFPVDDYTLVRPYRILYVSAVLLYKHQWHVVEAVSKLRKMTGWHLTLDLVGPSLSTPFHRLEASIAKHDPENKWVGYHDEVAYDQLHHIYHQADLAVYASSCENMPNTLLEHMAAGLPIACSNRGPMPEILGDAGIYFNPEDSCDIATVLQKLILDPELRTQLSKASFLAASEYSWNRCADQTFDFLKEFSS
jgi:glycosyltransferase involved in cell wall biosynthesis